MTAITYLAREENPSITKSTLPVNPFRALINVRTLRMFPLSPPSYITTAIKSSRIVVAWRLWVAHVWVLTLISINTRSAIKGPSNKGRTFATIRPRCVHAFGWWQTLMGANKTLTGVFTRWRSIAPLITEMAKAWTWCTNISAAVTMRSTYFWTCWKLFHKHELPVSTNFF